MIENQTDVYECTRVTYHRGHLYEIGERICVQPGSVMTNINFKLVSRAKVTPEETPADVVVQVTERPPRKKRKTPEVLG